MAEAWRVVPHISLFDEIDARPLLDALSAARNLTGSDTLTLTAVERAVGCGDARPLRGRVHVRRGDTAGWAGARHS